MVKSGNFKIVVTLSLCLAMALGSHTLKKTNDMIDKHDREVIEYWLGGLRGLWAGYYNTFHHGT